jgi:hypothetical protein
MMNDMGSDFETGFVLEGERPLGGFDDAPNGVKIDGQMPELRFVLMVGIEPG